MEVGVNQMPAIRAEFGTTFVQREGVSKGLGDVVVDGEREDAWDHCSDG